MSLTVGIGLSKAQDPILAAKEAALKARSAAADEKISLAIVFASIKLSSPIILKTISAYLGDCPIIGCSAAAIIYETSILKEGIAVMALGLPEDIYLNASCIENINNKSALVAGEELGEKLLYGFQNVRRDLSIIFSDGLLKDSSSLITGMQAKMGKSFPIVGGGASDNLTFKKTGVYFNQDVLSDAACGALLGGKLSFGIGINHGWKPLGKLRRITRSEANIVYEIDGRPAAEIYAEYLSSTIAELRKELKRIFILYPVGIYLPGEEEYLLRNLISIGQDGSLVFQGAVPQDCQIRLMIGTKESCLSAATHATEEVKKDFLGKKINFALVFDSVSRYILLRRDAQKELRIIKEGLGQDVPLIGFYTYGEQAPLRATNYQGTSRLHNQTITILGVGI